MKTNWLTLIFNGKGITSKVVSPAKTLLTTVLFVSLLYGQAIAVTYYSRTNNGAWNVSSTWSTVGYGSPVNTGTFPTAGDVVNIGDGYRVLITGTAVCATLNIGQGTSGTLEYMTTSNYSVTVTGNITLNNGAVLWYNSNVNRTHNLLVGGNITNYGTIDFYYGANKQVNLTFNGSGNSIISGIGTWDLNNVTMNKSGTTAAQVNVQSPQFEAGVRNFISIYGTYVHNNTGLFNINPTIATFTIGPNVIFRVPLGTMTFASNADNLMLQGTLIIEGGTVRVGTTAGNQGIRTDRNGLPIPRLQITSGNLTVYGGITYGPASATEAFMFSMSGGTITLNSGTTGTNREVFCVNDRVGSAFDMSGGSIIIQKPNTAGALVTDFAVCGSQGTVSSTGGTVQFGNTSTPTGVIFNFRPQAGVTLPNFRITGNSLRTGTLMTSYGSTASFSLRSIYIDRNKTFDIRSIGGTSGDNKTMTLTSTFNGLDAFYNNGTFNQRLSTVTFNPGTPQSISGTVTTTFYNLSINNSSHVTLRRAANVSNYLSMVSGRLFTTNTNILTCQSTANASLGNNTSYVDGPMIHTFASTGFLAKTYPVGKSSSYRPVVLTIQHTNTTAVTYRAEIFNSPASALPFSLPPSIANVSAVRYVHFSRQPVANFSSGRIQMYYDTDDVVADMNSLLVAHDNGVNMWQNFGGTATANWTGNITSSFFNTFNTYFALANPPGGGNPLPVELVSFNAKLVNKKVEVKWQTQSEINNDYFTVERSFDNIRFDEVAIVNGAGNSTQTNSYHVTDEHPLKGISYYRLKQTDFDGTTTTYPVQVIEYKFDGSFTVYPNPADKPIVSLSSTTDLKNYRVTVRDVTGRTVPCELMQLENGRMELHFDESLIKKGSVYFISATDGIENLREKLIIQ